MPIVGSIQQRDSSLLSELFSDSSFLASAPLLTRALVIGKTSDRAASLLISLIPSPCQQLSCLSSSELSQVVSRCLAMSTDDEASRLLLSVLPKLYSINYPSVSGAHEEARRCLRVAQELAPILPTKRALSQLFGATMTWIRLQTGSEHQFLAAGIAELIAGMLDEDDGAYLTSDMEELSWTALLKVLQQVGQPETSDIVALLEQVKQHISKSKDPAAELAMDALADALSDTRGEQRDS